MSQVGRIFGRKNLASQCGGVRVNSKVLVIILIGINTKKNSAKILTFKKFSMVFHGKLKVFSGIIFEIFHVHTF